MSGRRAGGFCMALAMSAVVGCGGTNAGPGKPSIASKTVKFVGFDANDQLVGALKSGEIQGLVLQNPYRMGDLAVRTLVKVLEKEPVERKISTGEAMATPENMTEPEIEKLLNPPRAHAQSAADSGGKKKWRVMVIPKGTTHSFWQSIHAGADKAAAELSVEIDWEGPEKESDRNRQIELVQSAVGKRVDGIILAPLDSAALVGPVEDAIAKGIQVVIIDSALESDKPASYVATDNYHGGVLAARRLGTVLNGEGKIVLMRYAVGSASTQEREKGFEDTIAQEFPKVTYLSKDQYGGATADTAQRTAQNLVVLYRGQADGVFCPNESSTFGMLRALEEAGMVKARP